MFRGAHFDARDVNPPADPEQLRIWNEIKQHQAEINRLENEYAARGMALRRANGYQAPSNSFEKIHAREAAEFALQQQQQAQRLEVARKRQQAAEKAEAERLAELRAMFPGRY